MPQVWLISYSATLTRSLPVSSSRRPLKQRAVSRAAQQFTSTKPSVTDVTVSQNASLNEIKRAELLATMPSPFVFPGAESG